MATESFVLKVLDVVEETSEAHSIVFEVPDDLAEQFAYTPGQFLTVAVPSEQTGLAARCYSLSSAPHEPLGSVKAAASPLAPALPAGSCRRQSAWSSRACALTARHRALPRVPG